MDIEITWGTLIDQLFARKTTFVTWRVTFSFLNERKGLSSDNQMFKRFLTLNLDIPQEYIWDVQDKYNLHSSRTNGLGFVLLHKYHSNIHQSHLQLYN